MAIFDSNLFVGTCPLRVLRHEEDSKKILASAKAAGGIFTSFSAVFHKDWAAGLLRDASFVQSRRSHLHGTVNPAMAGWQEDFRRLRDALPIVSIKVFPDFHQYGVRDLRKAALFATKLQLPLVIMRRLVDDRLVPQWWRPRPRELAPLLKTIKSLEAPRLVFSNFLTREIDPIAAEAPPGAEWYYEVGTFTPPSFWFVDPTKKALLPRLIYGSGAPLYYPAGALSTAHSGLSPSNIIRITSDNAKRCYGI